MNKETSPPAGSDKRYWAFISYSHADSKEAEWLHKSLESFKIPAPLIGTESRNGVVPRRIFPVFRDRDELPTSADLGANLHAALRNARYLVVLCSPNSAKSIWVNAEVEFFKKTHGNSNVLCLIVGGTPGGSGQGESAECFCPALKHHVNPDGRPGAQAEPIAADLRESKDGRLRAFLKIVAGILGVDFDALYQREKRRKRRRMLVVSAVAGLLALAGLIFYQRLESVAKSQSEIASEVKKMREMKFRSFGELPEERAQALSAIIGQSGVLEAEKQMSEALKTEEARFARYKDRLSDFGQRRHGVVERLEKLIGSVKPDIGWADAARVLNTLRGADDMPDEMSIRYLHSSLNSPSHPASNESWNDAIRLSYPFLDKLQESRALTEEMAAVSLILPSEAEVGSTEPQPGRNARLEHAHRLNWAAWLLVTDPDPSLRDNEKGLAFAKKANELTNENDPGILDTLAAAFAAKGDFESALRWQTLAVERGGSATPNDREGYIGRFRLYEAGQPFLEANSHGMHPSDIALGLANLGGLDAWATEQSAKLVQLETVLETFPATPEEKVVVDAEIQRLRDLQSQLESDGNRQLNEMRRAYRQSKAEVLSIGDDRSYKPLPEFDGTITMSERVWRKPSGAPERGTMRETISTVFEGGVPRQVVEVDREGSVELYCISRFVFAYPPRELDPEAVMAARNFARTAAKFLGVHLP